MKIIQLHNWHRFGGGSELVVETTTQLLRSKCHQVLLKIFDSRQMIQGVRGKLKAFACGIYSPFGTRTVSQLIREHQPDLVHIHELYPFFSPWILNECRNYGVPVVMTCHDYRLTCPIATHQRNGKVCERCLGGLEYWCFLKNCRNNIFESLAYATRSYLSTKFRQYQDNVTMFIALSHFAKRRLINAGFAADRIAVVPNMVTLPDQATDASKGEYASYIGRISAEKGIDTLLSVALQFPELRLKLAGHGPIMTELSRKSINNASFVGQLDQAELTSFYRKARFVVVPSKWFEGCPMVMLEAMSHGLPLIASRIGGLSEIVDDGVTGFLFEPGNVDDLTEKMRQLWEYPELSQQMGNAGREKMIREYSEQVYYRRLMQVYEKALTIKN